MGREAPGWRRRAAWCCLPLLAALAGGASAAGRYVPLPGGTFASVLPADGKAADATVAPFRLRTEPVTNAEFLAFVTTHAEWQRGRAASVLADAG